MCYACQNPFTASTDEKSVWINEYEKWAESSTNFAKEIFNEIVDNGEDLMETQYCECGEEECDPEAESDDDSIDIDDVEDADEETDFTMKLAEYRERKKKVADTFEIIKADAEHTHHPYDYDLYRDIETGRVFDLDGEEYFFQNQ